MFIKIECFQYVDLESFHLVYIRDDVCIVKDMRRQIFTEVFLVLVRDRNESVEMACCF